MPGYFAVSTIHQTLAQLSRYESYDTGPGLSGSSSSLRIPKPVEGSVSSPYLPKTCHTPSLLVLHCTGAGPLPPNLPATTEPLLVLPVSWVTEKVQCSTFFLHLFSYSSHLSYRHFWLDGLDSVCEWNWHLLFSFFLNPCHASPWYEDNN